MKIPYIRYYGDFGAIHHSPLKPTGKWKLVTNATEKNNLYIQHKGFIFKCWVYEDDIVFREIENIRIFDCNAV